MQALLFDRFRSLLPVAADLENVALETRVDGLVSLREKLLQRKKG